MKQVSWWLLVVAFVGLSIFASMHISYDDTDSFPNRSGLVLYRDAKTGCEYLARPFLGGLHPRMDGTGKQVCQK